VSFIIKTKPLTLKKSSVLVSVGKNSLKKASERNLLKRRVRAVLRKVSKEKKREFLVIIKPPVKEKTFREIKEEIVSQIPHLNLK
jgi:ribonuclease P protein component